MSLLSRGWSKVQRHIGVAATPAAIDTIQTSLNDRAARILAGVDVDNAVGLEIGPLAKPLVQRVPGRQIYYADYASQDVLREKSKDDPNVDLAAIPSVDFIIAPLPETLGMQFDYIVASHVGEHVPDFIGWIKTLFSWLKPGGAVYLALPDKRYTFDIYREMTTTGMMLEAFLTNRKTPPVSSIYDGFSKAVDTDAFYPWEGIDPPKPFTPKFSRSDSLSLATNAHASGEYRDCHCWVFSADTFRATMEEVRDLGLLNFTWKSFVQPEKYMIEFYAALSPAAR